MKPIDVCVYEPGEPDWWCQFSGPTAFFAWMRETFPDYWFDDKGSNDYQAVYHAGQTTISARGI